MGINELQLIVTVEEIGVLQEALHTHTHTQRHTHTHRHTHTQRDTQTETHTQRHTHRDRHRETDTHTHTHTHTDRDTHTQRHTHTETHTHTDTETHTHSELYGGSSRGCIESCGLTDAAHRSRKQVCDVLMKHDETLVRVGPILTALAHCTKHTPHT